MQRTPRQRLQKRARGAGIPPQRRTRRRSSPTTLSADLLPTELRGQNLVWKRPAELEAFPFWSQTAEAAEPDQAENSAGSEQSSKAPWCVVDFYVPPTPEEAAAAAAKAAAEAAAEAEKEAARKAAEEAGEPLPEEEAEESPNEPTPPPPPPREILRALKFSGTFPAQLVSVYDLISSVSKSYAAKKARDAPPQPSEEEIAAAAAAAEGRRCSRSCCQVQRKKKGRVNRSPRRKRPRTRTSRP